MEHSNNSAVVRNEVEPDPAQFAYENGLSIDSQVDPLSFYFRFDPSLPQMTPDVRLNGLTSDSSLHQLRIPLFPYLKEQQLDVTEQVLAHLHKAIQRDEPEGLGSGSLYLDRRVSIAKLKLEPPLLESDPDYDCHKLSSVIRTCREAQIDPHTFPPEQLNTALDETLDFPESMYEFRNQLEITIEIDKIDISKDVLYSLAKNLQDDWTRYQQRKLLEDETPQITTTRDLTVTPPLIPREETSTYFIPDDAVCQVPAASDGSTLLDDDLEAAEENIFQQDTIQSQSPSGQRLDTPMLSPLGDPPLLSPARPKLSSLKVEGPVTPVDSTPSPFDLTAEIENVSESLGIDYGLEINEPSGSVPGDVTEDYHNVSLEAIWTTMEEDANNLMRDIDQERLESTNALARVEVPRMDFSISEPAWLELLPLNEKSHLEWLFDTHKGFELPQWPRDPDLERQRLYWSPFPREPKIDLTESVDDHGCVEAALETLALVDVPTSAEYVWKQPGWAILRESESDDEIEPSQILNKNNLECLVKERHLSINNTNLETPGSSRDPSPVDLIKVPTSTAPPPPLSPYRLPNQVSSLLVDCSNPSATSDLLSNYIGFHAPKRRKCEKSIFFSKPAHSEAQPASRQLPNQILARSEKGLSPIRDPNLQQTTAAPVPCPGVNISDISVKFIKALSLSRGLFSRLEQLCPAATIIERDFDRWNTLSWDRNSISRSPVVSPLAAEADIIVSPSTGIVVTTLLKVIQKPPPGHKGQAAIRERVSKVALRYENLIILVSESNRTDETVRGLTSFECSAYTEFCGFVAGLDMNAHVYYVGGGNDTLARWVLSFVARYAPEAAGVQGLIIQDETSWELFLRRTGMNAYAAQAILGSLKAPEGIPEEQAGCFGLPAFVRMTPVERMQAFRGLMGGERVLRRVNEIVENVWNSNPTW
ncbi:hypothetical protein F4809DRAFT_614032 [Biscogniauxia mediterranea]|nr:hypothetical protein F4809DRAFT_614032 [Biscogniauxia mediterranea]